MKNIPPINYQDSISQFSKYAECKRILNQIVAFQLKNNFKSLAVLSQKHGEGKSLFISSLAVGYSELLKKTVLVVDTVDSFSRKGLSLKQVLLPRNHDPGKPAPTSFERVNFLSFEDWAKDQQGGEEYLVSFLIQNFKDHYDLILFDTLGLGVRNRNNIDPIVVAHQCEQSILVVSKITQDPNFSELIKNQIQSGQIRLLGIVQNEGVDHE